MEFECGVFSVGDNDVLDKHTQLGIEVIRSAKEIGGETLEAIHKAFSGKSYEEGLGVIASDCSVIGELSGDLRKRVSTLCNPFHGVKLEDA